MSGWMEMARDLGGAMARTDEYQALHRAIKAADDDRQLVEFRNAMDGLERRIAESIQAGQEPDEELRREYEETFSRLQSNPSYQRLAAAQANFEKILVKVNDVITEGMQAGADSRIIIPGS